MISILMAAYNCEKYIAEQIESILAQTEKNIKLYIYDDKSTDSTFQIITAYANKHPDKIEASQNKENTGGAKHNFMKMMISHKDDYIMLSDHDDIWLPEKIQKSLEKIKEIEQEYGTQTPALVHTNLKVVDEDLREISPSYEGMTNRDYEKKALKNMITMNNAAGCTTIYNRALADLITTEPEYMVIHDWWLALMAAAFGKIGVIHEPTILYRQHGGNDIGAKKVLSPRYIRYCLTHIDEISKKIADSYKQAGSFLKQFNETLTEDQREMLKAYASIPGLPRIRRMATIVKHKTYLHGLSRKAVLFMLFLKEKRITSSIPSPFSDP